MCYLAHNFYDYESEANCGGFKPKCGNGSVLTNWKIWTCNASLGVGHMELTSQVTSKAVLLKTLPKQSESSKFNS